MTDWSASAIERMNESRSPPIRSSNVPSASPEVWIFILPRDDAMPMDMFLSAPPKPPMGCPLKCDSTSMDEYSARCAPTMLKSRWKPSFTGSVISAPPSSIRSHGAMDVKPWSSNVFQCALVVSRPPGYAVLHSTMVPPTDSTSPSISDGCR